MKKLLAPLLLFPIFAVAQETGESCTKLEDNTQRLACYDSLFMKSEQTENETKTAWEYSQEKDEMRDATTYYATNDSTNTANFGFPYGTSKAEIILRKSPKFGNDVMFSIHSGQFNSCFDGCKITVKFDNQKLENYSMMGTDDGSSDVLFISGSKNTKRFVDQLRKSKKVIIEASFFDHGREQFIFETDGLDWKHF